MAQLRDKIVLLLFTGLALGFSYSPRRQWKTLEIAAKEWKRIDQQALAEEIRKLYRSKLVERHENPDGSFTFTLNDRGKLRALTYHFEEMNVSRARWDGKWRMVIFDIPETKKRARDVLRMKLKELNFYEFQKSVFVTPFACEDEIEFIIEYLRLRPYVRTVLATYLDNELHLKHIFKLK